MNALPKFTFTKSKEARVYHVTRLEDGEMIGSVWRERLGWTNVVAYRRTNGERTHFPSRAAAARDLSFEKPIPKKSRLWVSIVQDLGQPNERTFSVVVDIEDEKVAKLDPATLFHASCAITFEDRGTVAGHVWSVDETANRIEARAAEIER